MPDEIDQTLLPSPEDDDVPFKTVLGVTKQLAKDEIGEIISGARTLAGKIDPGLVEIAEDPTEVEPLPPVTNDEAVQLAALAAKRGGADIDEFLKAMTALDQVGATKDPLIQKEQHKGLTAEETAVSMKALRNWANTAAVQGRKITAEDTKRIQKGIEETIRAQRLLKSEAPRDPMSKMGMDPRNARPIILGLPTARRTPGKFV
jgi:hypothetical protein